MFRPLMFRPATTPPHLVTLILLSALTVVSLNMFLPSLAGIAGHFQADYALVNLSIAGYAAMTAVLQLVMGPLSDRYGRRPVILAALVLYLAASLGCLLAPDIWSFLACRLLQGVIITAYAVSMAAIRDTAPPQQAAALMGYVAMWWAVGPLVAPLAGGTLDALFGWRANFVAFVVFGLALTALCWADFGETNKTPSATFTAQLRSYPELLGSRRFWGYSLCLASSVGAFYIYIGGAPLVATTLFAMSPVTLGLALGSSTAGFMLGSFLSGRFAARFALTTMMIAGRLVACAGLAGGLALALAGRIEMLSFFGACALLGLGNGLTLAGANAGALSVRPQLAGSAAGLSGALTVGGGAALSALSGALLTPANAAPAVLALMLLAALLGLAAALYVLWIDRREGPAPQEGAEL